MSYLRRLYFSLFLFHFILVIDDVTLLETIFRFEIRYFLYSIYIDDGNRYHFSRFIHFLSMNKLVLVHTHNV